MRRITMGLCGVLMLGSLVLAQQEYNPSTGQWKPVPDTYKPSYDIPDDPRPPDDLVDRDPPDLEEDLLNLEESEDGFSSMSQEGAQDETELRHDSLSEPQEPWDYGPRPPFRRIDPYRPARRR